MPTIQEIRGLGSFHHAHQFELQISPLPGSDGVGADTFSFLVAAASIPGMTLESAEIYLGAHRVKEVARALPQGTWNVSLMETADMNLLRRIRSWYKLQWDPESGQIRPKEEYQTTGYLYLLNGARERQYTCKLVGLFIEDFPEVTLDMATGEATRYEITFSYDTWIDE